MSHLGCDLNIGGTADVGEIVRSTNAGQVVFAGNVPGWGGVTVLRCEARPNQPFRLPGGATTTVVFLVIGHAKPLLSVGDLCTAGQPIATIEPLLPGVSSTGPHLHLEVVRGSDVEAGLVTLPGPGYSTDPVEVAARVSPMDFLDLNQRPPRVSVRTVKVFASPVMDVVFVADDTAIVSERGTISGAQGTIWRVNIRTGVATQILTGLLLPGRLDYDAASDEVLVAVQGEDRVIAINLASNAVRDVVTGINQVAGVAVDDTNSRYVMSSSNHDLQAVPFGGGAPTVIASSSLVFPGDVEVVGGESYFTNAAGDVMVLRRGSVSTLLPGANARGIRFDDDGDLWLASDSHQIVENVGGVLYSILGQSQAAGQQDGLLHEALVDAARDLAIRGKTILVATDDRLLIVE